MVKKRMYTSSSPHPADVLAGSRLRTLRYLRGMSQQALAQPLGLSFQQVQKYERGANRMSLSALSEFARILKVDVGEFFVQDWEQESLPSVSRDFTSLPDSAEIMRAMVRLPRKHRTAVISFVRALTEKEGS